MTLLLAFAALLMVAVLLSSLAHRTILSTAALFLVGGIVLGQEVTGVLHIAPTDPIVGHLANIALFSVLFTDGMRVGWADLRSAWHLPGRALALGLPLTLAVTAVLAHYLLGVPWIVALLIGAILSPTDPVFAGALVGNDKVPHRLRHLLNVESGVNDGLALPFVLVFLAIAAGSKDLHLNAMAVELGLGILIGVVVPWAAIKLERLRFFTASTAYEPLNALAIALLIYALATTFHGNLYLAAFSAGVTIATFGKKQRESFEHFGEMVAETSKLAALLVFGALISPSLLGSLPAGAWIFAVAAIVLARPIALAFAFAGYRLTWREQAAASWFGPKGFASVVYGLIVIKSGIPHADLVFNAVALTIVISILAHSSTDVPIAKWFDDEAETPAWHHAVNRARRRHDARRAFWRHRPDLSDPSSTLDTGTSRQQKEPV